MSPSPSAGSPGVEGAPRGRVAVFFALETLGTVAGLRDAVLMLAEHGYGAEVYVRGNPAYPPADLDGANTSLVADKPGIFSLGAFSLPDWLWGRGGRRVNWAIRHVYHPLWRRLSFTRELRRRHDVLPYRFVIALDSQALVDAAPYARLLEVPVVYWSLELLFREEIESQELMRLKLDEIRESRRASLVIVQDEWRAAALVAENRLDPERVALVPNAPAGTARRQPTRVLRERFDIPDGRRIVLCAGSIEPWAMNEELMSSAREWPEDFILVMHSRARITERSSDYARRVVGMADGKKLIVSNDPIAPGEYRSFVDAADIGLALYRPHTTEALGRNMELMGFSSGKIADYLQSGLPIVVSDTVGLRELIAEFGCGVSVSEAAQVGAALHTIAADYDGFAASACRCFDERLELRRRFAPVIERLDTLERTTAAR